MKYIILVLRAEIHIEEAVGFAGRHVVDRHDGLLLGNGTDLLDQGFQVFVVSEPVAVELRGIDSDDRGDTRKLLRGCDGADGVRGYIAEAAVCSAW